MLENCNKIVISMAQPSGQGHNFFPSRLGAMVLGKLPVPGRPTIRITVGQGPTALAVGAGGGCLDIFSLVYPFSPLSPSLWETARYRLKYCLKGPLNPKQPTNQPSRLASNLMLRRVYLVWYRLETILLRRNSPPKAHTKFSSYSYETNSVPAQRPGPSCSKHR